MKKEIEEQDDDSKKKKKKTEGDFFNELMKTAGIDIPVIAKVKEIPVPFLDTGSLMLNALISGSMNGGFAGNKITALAGEESTGKTFIALQAAKNFLEIHPNGHVFIFDSEDDPSKLAGTLKERGIDIRRVRVIPVHTIQEFRQAAINIIDGYLEYEIEDRRPMFFILDSLGNLSTLKEVHDTSSGKLNKNKEDVKDMTKTSLIRGLFRVLTVKLGEAKVPLLITNHTYQTMDPYGVKSIMCLCDGTLILDSKNQPLKIEDVKIGDIVRTAYGEENVSNVFVFDSNNVYEIEFEDGVIVQCTGEHKFLLPTFEWCAASDLLNNDDLLVVED